MASPRATARVALGVLMMTVILLLLRWAEAGGKAKRQGESAFLHLQILHCGDYGSEKLRKRLGSPDDE
jgi:hypothetical protein